MKFVPNRECGDCTACCRTVAIEKPGIVKLPYVKCDNLMDCGKCQIYDKRPKVCAEFYCAWRYLPIMSEEWQPNKIGALVDILKDDFPYDFPSKTGLRITVIDKQLALSKLEFARFIAGQIAIGVPIVICYSEKPGRPESTAFLNYALMKAVENRDRSSVVDGIKQAIELCEQNPKPLQKIENGRIVPA